jgi:hypothetical protein
MHAEAQQALHCSRQMYHQTLIVPWEAVRMNSQMLTSPVEEEEHMSRYYQTWPSGEGHSRAWESMKCSNRSSCGLQRLETAHTDLVAPPRAREPWLVALPAGHAHKVTALVIHTRPELHGLRLHEEPHVVNQDEVW